MEITRTQQFNSPKGWQTASICLNDLDLPEEELVGGLVAFRSTLLDLHAEEYLAMVMYRAGAFHRNEEKNEKLAGVRLSSIRTLRSQIVGSNS